MSRATAKARTRRRIVDSALQLSAVQGFAAVGLREVARAAGIAPSTFYRHFANMDELGLALIDEVAVSLRGLMRRARQRIRPDRSITRTSVETFMDYVATNPNHFRLLLGERVGSSKAFRSALDTEISRFVDELVEDMVRESQNKDRPLAHPRLAAEAMVTLVFYQGAKALDIPATQREELAEEIIRQLRMLLYGAETMAVPAAD